MSGSHRAVGWLTPRPLSLTTPAPQLLACAGAAVGLARSRRDASSASALRSNRRYSASSPLFCSTCGACTPGHFVTRIDRPGSIFCDKFLFVVATAPALIIHEVGIARSDRADSCGERILARRTTACVCGGREARPRNLRVIALLDKLGSPVLFLPPLRLKTADRRVSSV